MDGCLSSAWNATIGIAVSIVRSIRGKGTDEYDDALDYIGAIIIIAIFVIVLISLCELSG